jgi:hypothetical protein
MLKKHLTIFVLLVMAVGVFAQSIPSGTGRYEALANSPFILDAATNIFNNPAWNNYYRNYTFGDVGRNTTENEFDLTDPYGGVTFGVGKQWNLGIIINKPSDSWDAFNSGRGSEYYPSGYGISNPVVPIMGLIGYTASKNFHVSLAPYIRMWNYNDERSDNDTNTFDRTIKRSSSSIGANIGFLYTIKKGWIEGKVGFRMNGFKFDSTASGNTSTLGNGSVIVENEGGLEIDAFFRGWIYPTTGSKIALVPFIGFNSYSYKPKMTSGSTTINGLNKSWLGFHGGVGMNWPIVDDIQLSYGIKVSYHMYKADSTSVEYKSNNFILPAFYFAGETRIADWLTARVGFYRELNMWSSEDNVTSSGITTNSKWSGISTNSSYQTFNIGAGFHFGRFSIDATVSERWLKQGINFISGTSNSLFGVISMSYNFAK